MFCCGSFCNLIFVLWIIPEYFEDYEENCPAHHFDYTIYGAGYPYHHVFREGELYFRDYMNDHPALAKEYESLKLGLWKRYEHDRDGYTAAKTEFIRKITSEARLAYPGRYI